MKARLDISLTLHTLLAAMSCSAAYIAWSAPNFVERDSAIAIFSGTPQSIRSIVWREEQGALHIDRDDDNHVLVRFCADANAAVAPAETALAFPGNMQANDTFARLMPLLAVRKLGEEATQKAHSLGLEPPQATLLLARTGVADLQLQIGKPVFGGSDVYVRVPGDSVYLVRGSVFANLRQGAAALQNRQLLPLGISSIAKVVLRSPAATRTLVQRREAGSNHVYFVDPEHPEHKLALASEWIERLLRLRATQAQKAPPTGEPQITATFFDADGQLGEARLFNSYDAEDAQATSTYLPHTAVLASIGVEPLLRDLTAVFSEGK